MCCTSRVTFAVIVSIGRDCSSVMLSARSRNTSLPGSIVFFLPIS